VRMPTKPRSHIVILIALVVAACGTPASLDPATAESCSELVDMNIRSMQIVLDSMPGPGESPGGVFFGQEFFRLRGAPGISAANELCGPGEFDRLLCDRKSSLETSGSDTEQFVEGNFPPCE